ncbi:MAG: hypothetical protein ABJC13_00170 [Acidobacteriota bacterium]
MSASLYAASSQVSSLSELMRVTTAGPASAGRDSNERPALVRKSFARSQSLNRVLGPTKTWKPQSLAATETHAISVGACRHGLRRKPRALSTGGDRNRRTDFPDRAAGVAAAATAFLLPDREFRGRQIAPPSAQIDLRVRVTVPPDERTSFFLQKILSLQ